MTQPPFRQALAEYIRTQAKPPDKFSHQPRLYRLARRLAGESPFDDDVVWAAAWLHDLGVFIGHRPEDPAALAAWDNVAYAIKTAPEVLRRLGYPEEKILAVMEVIRTHLPAAKPESVEAVLLRDADILEQLGAVGILRTVSKVGRDTRFARFGDALSVLQRNLAELPARLQLASARALAKERLDILKSFLAAADAETDGIPW